MGNREQMETTQGAREELVADAHLIRQLAEERDALRMNYLGVLGLLAETSVMLRDNGAGLAEETRDLIADALTAARELIPQLRWRRVLDAFIVEVL